MIMTYAAQVRSVSKTVSPQQTEDDFYDINSLRIICKYFVGSIVTVKTIDEVIEGVLHTISHNKICMTMVTIAKLKFPEMITEIASNKLINLSDVLFISTKSLYTPEVTVKGKYIKIEQEITSKRNENLNNFHKKDIKPNENGKIAITKIKENGIPVINDNDIIDKSTITEIKSIENSVEANLKVQNNSDSEKPKKTFAFNPNAPEFKPRSNHVFSDNVNGHILFSPHAQQFSPVFTPNSAPAIFVPNIFFYAHNQPINNMESRLFDNNNNSEVVSDGNPMKTNNEEPFNRKTIPEIHVSNPTMSFQPMLPIFPPPLPIFVPNHNFKFNALPFNNTDLAIPEINVHTEEPEPTKTIENDENNELSNPSNWPPLPLPSSNNGDNNKSNKVDKSQE